MPERLRMDVQIRPLPWIRLYFQTQDSRVFGTSVPPKANEPMRPLDIRLGYVELGDTETSPITLRAGLQSLDLGDRRLLAAPEWILRRSRSRRRRRCAI